MKPLRQMCCTVSLIEMLAIWLTLASIRGERAELTSFTAADNRPRKAQRGELEGGAGRLGPLHHQKGWI